MSSFGERVSHLRKAKGLSFQRLADLSGISKGHLWSLAAGNSVRPSAAKVTALAQALGVTAEYLLNGDVALADAEDQAFFSRYLVCSREVKIQMQEILKIVVEGAAHDD